MSQPAREKTAEVDTVLHDYLVRLQASGRTSHDWQPKTATAMLMGTLFADAMGRDCMPECCPARRAKPSNSTFVSFSRPSAYRWPLVFVGPLGHRPNNRRSQVSAMSRMRSSFVLVAGLAACAALGAGCSKADADAKAAEAAAPAVIEIGKENVVIVSTGTLRVGPIVSGTLSASREATVRAEVGGSVLKVGPDEGEAVKRGQMLAQIDARALGDAVMSAESAAPLRRAGADGRAQRCPAQRRAHEGWRHRATGRRGRPRQRQVGRSAGRGGAHASRDGEEDARTTPRWSRPWPAWSASAP